MVAVRAVMLHMPGKARTSCNIDGHNILLHLHAVLVSRVLAAAGELSTIICSAHLARHPSSTCIPGMSPGSFRGCVRWTWLSPAEQLQAFAAFVLSVSHTHSKLEHYIQRQPHLCNHAISALGFSKACQGVLYKSLPCIAYYCVCTAALRSGSMQAADGRVCAAHAHGSAACGRRDLQDKTIHCLPTHTRLASLPGFVSWKCT